MSQNNKIVIYIKHVILLVVQLILQNCPTFYDYLALPFLVASGIARVMVPMLPHCNIYATRESYIID